MQNTGHPGKHYLHGGISSYLGAGSYNGSQGFGKDVVENRVPGPGTVSLSSGFAPI